MAIVTAGLLVYSEWLYGVWANTWVTTQQPCIEYSKTDYTFAFKKDFQQPFVNKSESVVTIFSTGKQSMWQSLERSSLVFSQHKHGQQWLTRTCTNCLLVVVGSMHTSCVCVMSVGEICQRMIIKLTVQVSTILCLFLLCFCSVCMSPIPCQLVSAILYNFCVKPL